MPIAPRRVRYAEAEDFNGTFARSGITDCMTASGTPSQRFCRGGTPALRI